MRMDDATAKRVEDIQTADPMGPKAWDHAIDYAQTVILDADPSLVDDRGRISNETDSRILTLAARTFLAWHADNWSAFR